MDARGARWLCVWAALAGLGASFRTANFQVVAPTPQLAQQVAESAERYRRQLAETWLGQQLPAWSSVCTIICQPTTCPRSNPNKPGRSIWAANCSNPDGPFPCAVSSS